MSATTLSDPATQGTMLTLLCTPHCRMLKPQLAAIAVSTTRYRCCRSSPFIAESKCPTTMGSTPSIEGVGRIRPLRPRILCPKPSPWSPLWSSFPSLEAPNSATQVVDPVRPTPSPLPRHGGRGERGREERRRLHLAPGVLRPAPPGSPSPMPPN